MNYTCTICNALELPSSERLENTILARFGHFALLPTIGPMVDGHAMLASLNHYDSLASMPHEAVSELFDILDAFKQKYPFFKDLLVFEHGSFENQRGGSCTTHTHIHLLPNHAQYFNVLDNVLPVVPYSLSQIRSISVPYIFTLIQNGNSRIYEAYNAHSQMMRKAICYSKGITDLDWKANPLPHSIENTLKFWQ
ncbi:HIT domain-containing protein [Hymenobacter sp. CRA2]|uniref:HIT domain-containing protein n=1 Tax=Hymenobacter sp. CRA2 TaxID=1955620 RepID=UPI0011172122|nr:HIT domain-containing protein [Hymenobacter sp. CRA2]